MSYNPDRHGPQAKPRNQKRQRLAPPKGSGITHSTIVSRQGIQAVTIDDVRNKVNTPRGFKVQQFKGEDFEVVYEFICARNSTGQIKNDDQDRSIRVLAGRIFITIDEEIADLHPGQSVSIARGKVYEMATSGTDDAEVLITQGPDYEDNIEVISESKAFNAQAKTVFAADAPQRPPRSNSDKAMEHAQRLLHQRRVRETRRRSNQQAQVPQQGPQQIPGVPQTPPSKRPPLVGQSVTGKNPQPIGAGGYGDE
jgi:mannose-6-phosphate isomerase-like protein (cupin superfamily)